MPLKTAEKKLLLPSLCVAAILVVLACLPMPGDTERFEIEHGGCLYLPVGDGFAAVSPSGLSIYSRSGELLTEEMALDTELCAAQGDNLAVVSGEKVRRYSAGRFSGEVEVGGEPLALAVYGHYMAVSRRDSRFACAVTFYERTERLFTRYIAGGECTQVLLLEKAACLLLPGEIQILTSPEEVIKIHVEGARALRSAWGGFCAIMENELRFYSLSGEEMGVWHGEFTQVSSFGDVLCAMVPKGAAVIGSDGSAEHVFSGVRPLAFGMGELPAVIMGEETFIFNEKMEFLYSVENKYIPLNVITDKGGAIFLWQRVAQVHRK